MLINVSKQITTISDNPKINAENHLEYIKYIDNVFLFINKLKMVVPMKNIIFIPTFKGELTCQKFGIISTAEENTMKLFKIKSMLFLEDNEIKEKIKETFKNISESIIFDNDIAEITLKEGI